ncbi:MAG: UDP-N-acetylmuramate--L-alanine ligase [Gemmatimonadales bacterium]|nr:MAG: UDP-N-acetylmuramate--L-alanine ligase [Gemmatimonadales bacterium]
MSAVQGQGPHEERERAREHPGDAHPEGHGQPDRDLRVLAEQGVLHFMGAGGAGMCALAEAVVRGGGSVTACDRSPGRATRMLEALGVTVHPGHDPAHVEEAAALVVTAAIPTDHPEIARARERGIPVVKRAEALGSWTRAGRLAAVAGTHGKTTTTAILVEMLAASGHDPTGLVGGEVARWKSHLRPGRDDLFVVEADEYDRSFHYLHPDVTVVTNMEADHLDIYGSVEGIRDAFARYLENVVPEGRIWACADDPGSASLLVEAGARGRSYGFSAGSQLRGEGLETRGFGTRLKVVEDGHRVAELQVPLPGLHNARNALGAAAAARSMGAGWNAIARGLQAFAGVRRRFQLLGKVGGIHVVDDYAHHPTEVKAALEAARRSFPEARIVAVFQPHLYSRTRDFAPAFGEALSRADRVWVTDIYPAREAPLPGVDAGLVVQAARAGSGGGEVQEHGPLETLPEAVARELAPGDVCLTLGAGSIEEAGPRILQFLEARHG